MRGAGLVVGRTLELLRAAVAPGMTTQRPRRHRRGVDPQPRRRPVLPGLPRLPRAASARRSTTRSCTASPATGCSSRATRSPSTAARSSPAGTATPRSPSASARSTRRPVELSRVTEDALWAGLARPSWATGSPTSARPSRPPCASTPGGAAYGIVEEYVGHGIGTSMHMDPNVPNYAAGGRSPRARRRAWRSRSSRWSAPAARAVRDARGRLDRGHQRRRCAPATGSTPWRITADGPWVLTALDGGAARFAALGVASPAAARA